MIVILSEQDDATCQYAERRLRDRGAAHLRIDPVEMLAYGGGLVAQVSTGVFRCELRTASACVDLATVRSVWVRRPSRVAVRDDIKDPFFKLHTEQSWQRVIDDVARATTCAWLPARPSDLRRAEAKLLQLRVAERIGFLIPDTLVSTDKQSVFDFYRKYDGRIISKMAASFPVPKPAPPFGRYTERVLRSDLGYIATSAHLGPCLFQPEITKRVELRVTVVGDRVFAAEIDSQSNRRTALDWRHYDLDHTPHRVHSLPSVVQQRCVELTKALGLSYAALDFIITPNEEYVFLEANPGGQYLWIEELTQLSITDAICDFLIEAATDESHAI